jgi:hypothetical protein
MLKAIASGLLKLFLKLSFGATARGRALAETRILWLTSGDALRSKGSSVVFRCYYRFCTLQKVTSGVLPLESGSR